MNPFTKLVASKLPNQYHKHALETDSHLRVKGAPLGTVYCIGDASTIETNLVDHLWELLDLCDEDKECVQSDIIFFTCIPLKGGLSETAARSISINSMS